MPRRRRSHKGQEPDRVRATCPCCKARLTVDTSTGEILAHQRPRKDSSKTLEDALSREKRRAERRDTVFSDALKKTTQREDLLGKKFEEASKEAAKDPSEKPKSPLDWD